MYKGDKEVHGKYVCQDAIAISKYDKMGYTNECADRT